MDLYNKPTQDNSYPTAGVLTNEMVSLYGITEPQNIPTLFRRYGDQYANLMMMFKSMGRDEPTPNPELYAWEENWLHDSITVLVGNAAANAGATVSITVDTTATGGNTYARVDDVVTLTNEMQMRVMTKVIDSPTQATLTLKGVREDQRVPEIGNGDSIAITTGASGYGTAQPEGAVVGHTQRGFRDQIIKEEFVLQGQEFTREKWVKHMSGKNYDEWYTTGIQPAEYRLGLKYDGAITFGEQGDGSLTVPADTAEGGGSEIPTTRGMIPWVRDLGQVLEVTPGAFDTSYLKSHSLHMKRNGAVTNIALAIMGAQINNDLDDALVSDLGSTNVDYTKIENTVFKGNRELSASWNFKYITKYGVTWMIRPHTGWSNPKTYAAPGYHMEQMGIILPWGTVKDKKTGMKVSNVGTKYIAGKGYSRKVEVWPTKGAGGGTYVHDIDKAAYHLRTHMMFTMLGVNQCTLLDPISDEVSISGA